MEMAAQILKIQMLVLLHLHKDRELSRIPKLILHPQEMQNLEKILHLK